MEEDKDVWMDKVIVAVRKICFDNIKNGKYNMSSKNTENKNYIFIFRVLLMHKKCKSEVSDDPSRP